MNNFSQYILSIFSLLSKNERDLLANSTLSLYYNIMKKIGRYYLARYHRCSSKQEKRIFDIIQMETNVTGAAVFLITSLLS